MCCLQKAFAASNLSELVAKIMQAKYSSLPNGYSDGLKDLMKMLFQVILNKSFFLRKNH